MLVECAHQILSLCLLKFTYDFNSEAQNMFQLLCVLKKFSLKITLQSDRKINTSKTTNLTTAIIP